MTTHRKMWRHALCSLLMIGLFGSAVAQKKGSRVEGFWNQSMYAIAESESNHDWVYFKDEVNPDPTQLFTTHAQAFELGADDEFRLKKLEDDDLGYRHYRYDQFYKGKQIVGGEFIIHVNSDNKTYLANGKMVRKMNKEIQSVYTEDQALALAMDFVGEDTWLWETEIPEHKQGDQGYNLVMYEEPKGKLVWVRASTAHEFLPEYFYLAWEFKLHHPGGENDARVFVDASSGAILDSYPLSMVCNYGSGTTTWNGTRNFYTDAFILFSTTYDLEDDCGTYGGGNITTLDGNFGDGDLLFVHEDNSWTDFDDRHAVTTHWGVRESKRYFNTVHGRASHNNSGGSMTAKNNEEFDGGWNNACYCGGDITFGPGVGPTGTYDPDLHWNTLDIVAHEWTHAVVSSSAGLTYSNESGALNESFADIFGNVVPRYLGLETGNWLIGETRMSGSGAIRDMANPKAFNDPDTYLGVNWFTGSGDNGGVHTNSGVMNRWFTLLVDGGSGSNDWSDDYSVSAIGIVPARDIAYRNLNVYLTSGSQYIDARQGSLQASNDLYGFCSFQSEQVGKAWYAVGVGNSLTTFNYTLPCGSFSAPFFNVTYTGIEEMKTTFGCNTTITPGSASMTFRSGKKVVLREGFTAEDGSNFTAKLDDCSYAVYKMPDEFAQEEVPQVIESPAVDLMQLTASPNPFTDQFMLKITMPEEEEISIRMIDLTGRTVKMLTQNTIAPLGTTMLNADVSEVPSGMYLVILESASYREEIRVECIR